MRHPPDHVHHLLAELAARGGSLYATSRDLDVSRGTLRKYRDWALGHFSTATPTLAQVTGLMAKEADDIAGWRLAVSRIRRAEKTRADTNKAEEVAHKDGQGRLFS